MRDGQNVEVGQTGGRKKEERGKEEKEDESGGRGVWGGGRYPPPHGLAIGDLLEAIDGTDVSSWALSQIARRYGV